MDYLSDIFSYSFFQRALIAAFVTGAVCGLMGVYMVVRRLVFFAGGITHSAFGGLGLAYFLGINTLWGSLFAGMVSAYAVEKMTDDGKIREDSAIGILWSVGMAVGIIFILLTPGYAPNLMSFLFGNILMVTGLDIWLLFVLLVTIMAVMIFWGRKIIYVSLDREYARSQHLPVKLINNIMLFLLSMAIILSLKTVGIMLLLSLLTVPATIAGMLSNDYFKITIISCIISVFGLIAGIFVSYAADIPSSAVTVVILVVLLLIFKLLKR